jgi:putative tryptophan/tyrosine transport system substrate-binding protein
MTLGNMRELSGSIDGPRAQALIFSLGNSSRMSRWPVCGASKPAIGFLGSESPALSATYLRFFREALRRAGYIEGQNVKIEYAWAEGHNDRLPSLVTDLIKRDVSIIVAPVSTPAPLAARKITTEIPIV